MSDTKTPQPNTRSGNKPLHRVHMGTPVFVKIWENIAEDGSRTYTTSVGRTYSDPQTGEPRDTASLSQSELAQLPTLIRRADDLINQLREQDRVDTLMAQRERAFSSEPNGAAAKNPPLRNGQTNNQSRAIPEH